MVNLSREFRSLGPAQRRAFAAAFLGWMLDGFDFTILTFVLADIQQHFSVNSALAGALGTVTLMFRLVGGAAAGTAADRWGRKLPLVLSILWFSLFTVLSGFSTSYAMLFTCRALFGIGMGGEWAAGMPLALEHLPDRLRGAAAGILQGAWAWGYILSAVVFQTLYPVLPQAIAWRVLLWTGAVPALVVLWIRARVVESPVWLERAGVRTEVIGQRAEGRGQKAEVVGQRAEGRGQKAEVVGQRAEGRGQRTVGAKISLARIFEPDLIGTTLQCSVLAAAFMVSYYAVTYWYATFLRERQLNTLPYLVALNVGGIIGSAFWGWSSEGRLGRRGAVTCAALLGIVVSPLYVLSSAPGLLMAGAFLVGLGAHGMWGAFPSYLTERFPPEVRGAGAGFCYHAGALVGSFTSSVIGYLRDSGIPLSNAMAMSIAASGVAVAILIWLGPETRGKTWNR